MAIAIGLNDGELPQQSSTVANVVRAVEPPAQRAMRNAVLGDPAIAGRRDLLRRFLSAVFAAANSGAATAQASDVSRELISARTPAGFSFANIAAERAGARFAQGVLDRRFSLGLLEATFNISSFMPDIAGLPEKLSAEQFAAQFGAES